MSEQTLETVEKNLKGAGMKPTPEVIKEDAIVAQVSGTQYHVISDLVSYVTLFNMFQASRATRESTSEGTTVVPAVMSAVIPKKNITQLFPAYWKLLDSIERLPENIDDERKSFINEKIEELSRTIIEFVSSTPRPTPQRKLVNFVIECKDKYNCKIQIGNIKKRYKKNVISVRETIPFQFREQLEAELKNPKDLKLGKADFIIEVESDNNEIIENIKKELKLLQENDVITSVNTF
jgi:hypothetical protein